VCAASACSPRAREKTIIIRIYGQCDNATSERGATALQLARGVSSWPRKGVQIAASAVTPLRTVFPKENARERAHRRET
jgi:hypothetical protein